MIVSIGEVVWDIFSDKEVLGGAPINVAYHLTQMNLSTHIVTRVGNDVLGDATKARLIELGLDLAGVQTDDALPTGRVNVTIDGNNEPHFDIVAPAAWDNISRSEACASLAGKEFSLVFGTLGQRDSRSREAVRTLWQRAALCFYDVNLRPPFTSPDLVTDSLMAANFAKVNDSELFTLAQWYDIVNKDKKNIAQNLCKRYDLAALIVTEGEKGAWVLADNELFSQPAAKVKVADTVGAGDAFFAAVIEGILAQRPWPENLSRANQRGGYVAARHGATPSMANLGV